MTNRQINFSTAISVVIANMIGTGVFTSLGYQLLSIDDFAAIIFLWMLGGVIALCGALAYSELGAALPRSGGEYNFLSEIFHPSVGFMSGWVSATIGFAAPIAAAALALGKYMNTISTAVSPEVIGSVVIISVGVLQSINYHIGGGFQTLVTALKVILILVFCVLGFAFMGDLNVSVLPTAATFPNIKSIGFAISLLYVSYAYSGWNASAYIAGEVKNPQRNLPLSILAGTFVVGILYVMLNYVFLKTAPVAELKGVAEVGFVSASHIFGANGGKLISLIISVLLVSTISSMVIVGPRVIQMIGEDYSFFKPLARKNKVGIPVLAIWIQIAISLVLLLTSSFETIITYISFTLNLMSTLTVLGVIVLRYKKPELYRPYKTWGYPFTAIFFVLVNAWFLYYVMQGKPKESLIGILISASGLVVYFVAAKLSKKEQIAD